jgi:hypothetical protein
MVEVVTRHGEHHRCVHHIGALLPCLVGLQTSGAEVQSLSEPSSARLGSVVCELRDQAQLGLIQAHEPARVSS